MRLSDEKSLLEQMTIEQARQNIALLKAEEIEMPKKWVLELLNTIEALQQENEQLKEQINTAKIGWDTYKTYSEQLEQQTAESNKIIETQRQEIEKLKATIADWKYNAKCDADHIAALTADKDEQARKTRQLEEGLRSTLKVLETLNYRGGLGLDIHKWLRDEMQTVNALLGGKEDE